MSAIEALPRGLCGVVFRHDDTPNRAALGQRVATLCHKRGLPLVVAGDMRLAARLGAGAHLRGGRWPGVVRPPGLITASAHSLPQLRRGLRAGAAILFLSPAAPTASHPQARPLGPRRWRALARRAGVARIYCLGGITASNVKAFGRLAAGAGAIGALSPGIEPPPAD